uniref:Uncharacterized protein n=1 Tax=Salmo trutta TaxID=8032 RepID=A0A674CKI3_SALTR
MEIPSKPLNHFKSKVLEYRAKTTTRVTVPIHLFSQTIHQDSVSKSPENWGPVKVSVVWKWTGS